MHYVGVDGCRAGWLAMALGERDDWSHMVAPSMADVARRYPQALVLVDIPIGLRDDGWHERRCDIEARAKLGTRRASSVFPAPCRSALGLGTYAEASADNHRRTGRRLSKQSFAIAPRIADVEEYLRRNWATGPVVREMHPEVCFWGLAGRPMEHQKRTAQGAVERIGILSRFLGGAKRMVEDVRAAYGKAQVRTDDIIDALAGAVTARVGGDNVRTLPSRPEVDRRGLRMEMVYAWPGPETRLARTGGPRSTL